MPGLEAAILITTLVGVWGADMVSELRVEEGVGWDKEAGLQKTVGAGVVLGESAGVSKQILPILILGPGSENSQISSSACMSSSLIHWLWAAEYPFHLTRYCFFFQWP